MLHSDMKVHMNSKVGNIFISCDHPSMEEGREPRGAGLWDSVAGGHSVKSMIQSSTKSF